MPEHVVYLYIAPFIVRLQSDIPDVLTSIESLYQNKLVLTAEQHPEIFSDYHVRIIKVRGLRSFYRPQVQFYFDGKTPFKPLPYSQAFPFFEWGVNWCITNHTYQYLLLHAAVIEKNGKALILPGQPGAGKSTLCAALVCRGWRLLSDEMAVIDMHSKELIPIVRPVSLKNESITIIKDFSPEAVYGTSFLDTAKGTVAHMRPPDSSYLHSRLRVVASRIVFPQYQASAATNLLALPKGQALLKVAENSFNYNVLGNQGFATLCDLIQQCDCAEFVYSDLDEAVHLFSNLYND